MKGFFLRNTTSEIRVVNITLSLTDKVSLDRPLAHAIGPEDQAVLGWTARVVPASSAPGLAFRKKRSLWRNAENSTGLFRRRHYGIFAPRARTDQAIAQVCRQIFKQFSLGTFANPKIRSLLRLSVAGSVEQHHMKRRFDKQRIKAHET